METDSTEKLKSLFPAYASVKPNDSGLTFNNEVGTKLSESQGPKKLGSLFPAYGSNTSSTSSTGGDIPEAKVDEDWLCNSSFTPNNYEEAVAQYKKSQESDVSDVTLKTECDASLEKVNKERKRKKERKKYKPPDISKIPEEHSIRSQLNKKTFIEETGLSFERAFREDPRLDPENVQFDCFEQTKIARYKSRHVVPFGFSSSEKTFWSNFAPKKNKKEFVRYCSQKAIKSLIKNLTNETVIIDKSSSPHNLNFIPLSKSVKNDVLQCSTKPSFDGVSVDWKSYIDTNSKEKSDDKIAPDIPLEFKEKIVLFNKILTESPHDVQMWLDFVDFQDELFSIQQKTNAGCGLTEDSIIEKKISILDKALKHNPKSVPLNVARLNLCKNKLKPDDLVAVWENLIFVHPNSIEIWLGYLNFMLTNITLFHASTIQKIYSKCLLTLSRLSEGLVKSHEPPQDIIPNMIYIFSQLCFVLKNTGYTEKAIALYQALIELNIFCEVPMALLTASEKISCFEPFWDSGAARIGEDGAIGWAATVSQKKIVSDKIISESDLNNLEDEILCKRLSLSKAWIEFEKLRENHHWLPWRPNPEYDQTDDDIDDIDRCVSFDNISRFLFSVTSEEDKFILIKNFIKFLGFDFHQLQCNCSLNNNAYYHIDINNFEKVSNKLNCFLFQNQFLHPLSFQTSSRAEDRIHFINNIFSLVVNEFSTRYRTLLTLLWLKFQRQSLCTKKEDDFRKKLNDLKGFSKQILKKSENRNCLVLWLEYIQTEWLLDKTKAIKTFFTLLTSSSAGISSGSLNMSELWYFIASFINLSIGLHEDFSETHDIVSTNELIWILIHIGSKETYVPYNGQTIKSTSCLKAAAGFRYFLDQELKSLASMSNWICYCADPYSYSFLDCAKCCAYFQYFSQGIEPAIKSVKDVISMVKESCIAESNQRNLTELMKVFEAQLLNFHTWNSTASIKPLQLNLHASVEQYSSNCQLLLLLVNLRNASSVINPTRRFWSQILKAKNQLLPVTWIFALASELSISYSVSQISNFEASAGSVVNSSSCWGITWKIRTLYEKALNSQMCASTPILWRSYIKYEIQNGDVQRAKGIFYRAMQNCGWCKDLLMDGIEYFPDDLKQILDFIAEKQIRIHTPLEEVTLLMEHAVQD
ncbi:nuclear exosome regulator NRDE2-like [Uloborus diversus]|uniref:nuclear exosome regulator NRDE2-like n=1 Tax=Uloborus diversus TaxID=327109 RepID=UPI0024095B21|nr:nuclear exosome regulator NRDE2-like [Uloborus diversus]